MTGNITKLKKYWIVAYNEVRSNSKLVGKAMVQNMMNGYSKKTLQLPTYSVSFIGNTRMLLDPFKDLSFALDRPIPGNNYRRRVVAFLKGGVVSGYANMSLYFLSPFSILSSVRFPFPHSLIYCSF